MASYNAAALMRCADRFEHDRFMIHVLAFNRANGASWGILLSDKKGG